MDYVSSTYLISINCFRMLRLMNKKDSGLFGGPESETGVLKGDLEYA